MDDRHIFAIELSKLSISVLNLNGGVNCEHVNVATFTQEDLRLFYKSCVSFLIQSQAHYRLVVLTRNNKESGCKVGRIIRSCKLDGYHWTFRAAERLAKTNLLANVVDIRQDPSVLHFTTSPENKRAPHIPRVKTKIFTGCHLIIICLIFL